MPSLAERALELVRLPSPIGHEGPLADLVQHWAHRHFGAHELHRVSHSFVLGDLKDTRPTVALIGHLDTVPAHPGSKEPHLDGDRLFGLGSSDMKGALAVMMALAEELPRASLPVNVLWVLYEKEEGPYLESGLGPLFERVPQLGRLKLGIAMEPTDGAVQVGCVGSLHATLSFQGQAAHSARPWQGKNAIHAAGGVLSELAARERVAVTQDGLTFYEVMSATLAKGGRARNVVPEHFEVNVNYRFAPGKSVEQAQADVRALVRERCVVDFSDAAPSGRVCLGNPLVQRLVQATGRAAEAKQAWTDVARFSEWGVDAVNYGPGETAQAHQRDESCSVAALQASYDVLDAFLRG